MILDLTPLAKAAEHLAEPVNAAIERVASGCGRMYEPTNKRRMARAQVDADYITQIGKQDLEQLAEAYDHRETYRKARHQLNLGLIADRVVDHLSDVPAELQVAPDDDWLDEFEIHAEKANTAPLQELWSRLMAGEIKRKGAVPRRVLRHFRDLDQRTASNFQKVFSCSVKGNARLIFVYDGWEKVCGITFFDLKELADMGLIDVPIIKQCTKLVSGQLAFFDRCIRFGPVPENTEELQYFLFTRVGEVLSEVCDQAPNEAYFRSFFATMTNAKWNIQPALPRPASLDTHKAAAPT